jgi:hypothetical protein
MADVGFSICTLMEEIAEDSHCFVYRVAVRRRVYLRACLLLNEVLSLKHWASPVGEFFFNFPSEAVVSPPLGEIPDRETDAKMGSALVKLTNYKGSVLLENYNHSSSENAEPEFTFIHN